MEKKKDSPTPPPPHIGPQTDIIRFSALISPTSYTTTLRKTGGVQRQAKPTTAPAQEDYTGLEQQVEITNCPPTRLLTARLIRTCNRNRKGTRDRRRCNNSNDGCSSNSKSNQWNRGTTGHLPERSVKDQSSSAPQQPPRDYIPTSTTPTTSKADR
ncbi:hypothetical protein EVAR_83144_1 [Eumeta japonica]|uniref:Uncharacterized protein n=1 Tax=Eumeta variegata TaxID=151549 RepID=A0A4C1YCD5_EUMVA|nr:hypothetical protein EVAR_83144_1 [Eumeta japonica]